MGLFEEYNDLVKKGMTPKASSAGDNPDAGVTYDDLVKQGVVEEDSKATAMQMSVYVGAGSNPDEEAGLNKLSAKTGIPVEALRSPEVKQDAKRLESVKSVDFKTIVRDSPKTAEFLSYPHNAAVAHDDIGNLSTFERILHHLGVGLSERTVGGKIVRLNQEAGIIPGIEGVISDPTLTPEPPPPATPEPKDLLGKAVEGVGAILGDLPLMLAGGAGMRAAIGASEVTAASPWVIRAATRALTMGAEFATPAAIHPWIDRPPDESPIDTAGKSLESATLQGYVGAAMALSGLAGSAAGKLGGPASEKILSKLFRPDAAVDVAAGLGRTATQKAADTLLAPTAEVFGMTGAAAAFEGKPFSAEDLALNAATIGLLKAGHAVLGIPGFAGDVLRARDAARNQEAMHALGEASKDSKLRARLPEKYREFVEAATKDGPVENVFAPIEEWQTFWQSKGIDPEVAAREVGIDPASYRETKATGSDLVIPLSEYASKLAGTQYHPGLSKDLRLHPGDMTPREAEAFRKDVGTKMDELVKESATAPESASDQKVYDDVVAQLTAAGRAPEAAAKEATLTQAVMRTMGKRAGVDPFELYQRYGLKITATPSAPGIEGVPDGAVLTQGKVPPEGFPAERDGFTYDGTYEGTGVHQYTDRSDPNSPTWHDTIAVKAPEQLAGKIEGIRKARTASEILSQGEKARRGFIRFGPDRKMEIGLLENADLSTYLHESGHFYLEVLRDLAGKEGSDPGLKADWETMAKHLGIAELAPGDAIPQGSHETFARSFEAYLMEGKAPSPALASVFQRFKAWLVQVYREASRLGVKLNDDVRGVFDRLVATDEEISAAENSQRRTPIFATAEAAGMTDAEFKVYRKDVEKAHVAARDTLERELIVEFTRERKALWKAESERTRATVEEEANRNPVFQVYHLLTRGELLDGSTPAQPIKLSRKAFVEAYGKEYVDKLPPKWFRKMTDKEGMHPDVVAEMFGFSSGDEMIKRMLESPTRENWIREETGRRMREAHGDLLNDGSIGEAALAAVHNDEAGLVMRAELRALRRKEAQVRPFVDQALRASESQQRDLRREMEASIPPIAAFREAAQKAIGAKSLMSARPDLYLRAEEKAAKKAFDAAAKDDFETAATEKKKQLLNHYLFLEARKAQEEGDSIYRYVQGLLDTPAQERLGMAGQDFLEQVNGILEQYEFKQVSNKAIEQRKSLLEWARLQEEQGAAPAIPDVILYNAKQVNYRELTIDQLRAVRDGLKNIEHLARIKNRIRQGSDIVTLGEAQGDLALQVLSVPRKPLQLHLDSTSMGMIDRATSSVAGLSNSLIRGEFLMEMLDGERPDGPFTKLIWNVGLEAKAKKYELIKQILEPTLERVENQSKEHSKALADPTLISIKSLGTSMSRSQLLGVAHNFGNESNLDKAMRGGVWNVRQWPLSEEAVTEIKGKLTADDWKHVQADWDTVELLRPYIAELEKRRTGLEPEWVERQPFTVATADGQTMDLRGGYWPMVYDPRAPGRAGELQAQESQLSQYVSDYTKAATKRGYTKARTGYAGPVSTDWRSIMTRHLNDTITDISHWDFIYQTRRLIESGPVKEAIQAHFGDSIYRQLEGWLKGTVNHDRVGDAGSAPWMRMLAATRQRASVAILGARMDTAIADTITSVFAFPLQRISPRFILSGVKDTLGDLAKGTGYEVPTAMSEYFQHYNFNLDQNLTEALNRLTGKHTVLADIQRFSLELRAHIYKLGAAMTWRGAYSQAISEGKSPTDAALFGDKVVRTTQDAGSSMDISSAERNPLVRTFAMFMGPSIIVYNNMLRGVRIAQGAGQTARAAGAGAAAIGASVVFNPALWKMLIGGYVGNSLIYPLLRGKRPQDEDGWGAWIMAKLMTGWADGIPIVREGAQYLESQISGEHYALRSIPAVEFPKKLAETAVDAYRYGQGEGDSGRLAGNVLESTGWAVGLPAAQMSITGRYLYEQLVGEYDPEHPWSPATDLLYRRRKSK